MITIGGDATKRGIAIAVAAIADPITGIGGISPTLLQEGVDALKRGSKPEDYPEAILITDTLALGAAVRIPGVRIIGIAAQSPDATPGIDPDVPCVTALPDLLRCVSEGDLVIVDGNKGAIHIDPDPRTIVRYQQIEEYAGTRETVFITSQHIPARTQSGETVLVYALADSEPEVSRALDEGADGLLVDLRESGADLAAAVLMEAAGKPTVLQLGYPDVAVLRTVVSFARPGQVSVLFPIEDFDQHALEANAIVADLVEEALSLDLEPVAVNHGVYARENEYLHSDLGLAESMLAIDLRKSAYLRNHISELPDVLPSWIGSRKPEDVILLLGKHVETISAVVEAAGRAVAVLPKIVGAAKAAIRSVGGEDVSV